MKNFLPKNAVLLIIIVGTIGAFKVISLNQAAAQASPVHTTLEQIIAGNFPSAIDKSGAEGVLVQVENLTVFLVLTAGDGDWHVHVTDGKQPKFVTEIIPRDQARLQMPKVGQTITETGTPYCDKEHENEGWHGLTCWEIHPVTGWQPYTPVPEFPLSQQQIILLGVISLPCLMILRRKQRRLPPWLRTAKNRSELKATAERLASKDAVSRARRRKLLSARRAGGDRRPRKDSFKLLAPECGNPMGFFPSLRQLLCKAAEDDVMDFFL